MKRQASDVAMKKIDSLFLRQSSDDVCDNLVSKELGKYDVL